MKKVIVLLIAVSVSFAGMAQSGKSNTPLTKVVATAKYTCTMHPEVLSNKPGKCPKCGMALTKIKSYTCSMHPEIVTNKPGKCPKCGMDLTEVKDKPKPHKG